MNKFILITIILLFSFFKIDAVELTSENAEQMALAHSFQLKKAELESKAYQSNLSSAKAERYPTLSLDAKGLYNSNISSLDLTLPGFTLQKDIGQHQIYQSDLKISLPLYTGGKISSAVNYAEASLEIKDALLQKSSDEIRYMAKQEFLKLYKADKMINATRASVERTELVYKDIQSLYQAGAADSVDLFEIEFSYNNATLALAQSLNNRRTQEIILSVLLGLPVQDSIQIISSPEKPLIPKDLEMQIDEAKPELKVARSLIALSKSQLQMKKSNYAPNLSLFGNYAYGKPNISPFEEEFNSNFTIGAVLNWSLNLGGKTNSQVSMARYQVTASQHEYERVHEELQKQSQLAFEHLKLAFTNYETAVKNYNISKDNFRLAKIKKQEGVISTNHLLDIESKLSQAESLLYSTEADYHLILNQYQYISGYNIKEGN